VTKSELFFEIFRKLCLFLAFNSTPLPDIACDQLLPFTTKADIFLLGNDLVNRIAAITR
jgi:hypothetical protein